jgi:hypothetical protein
LFAKLFIQLGFKEVNDVTLPCHAEITKRKNIKGGHTDPISYFEVHGKTVEDFRNDVKKEIKNQTISNSAELKEVIQVAESWLNEKGKTAIDNLEKKGLINNPEDWKKKDLEEEKVSLGLFFIMLDRISND